MMKIKLSPLPLMAIRMIGVILIGIFVFRLAQGGYQIGWLIPVFLFNVFWLTSASLDDAEVEKKAEDFAMNKSKKYLKMPMLAKHYCEEKGINAEKISAMISRGEIDACSFDGIVVVDSASENQQARQSKK